MTRDLKGLHPDTLKVQLFPHGLDGRAFFGNRRVLHVDSFHLHSFSTCCGCLPKISKKASVSWVFTKIRRDYCYINPKGIKVSTKEISRNYARISNMFLFDRTFHEISNPETNHATNKFGKNVGNWNLMAKPWRFLFPLSSVHTQTTNSIVAVAQVESDLWAGAVHQSFVGSCSKRNEDVERF